MRSDKNEKVKYSCSFGCGGKLDIREEVAEYQGIGGNREVSYPCDTCGKRSWFFITTPKVAA
ncbi:hypothetical protein KKD19_01990 [Patescibacteria group bacterium]|nr:hypothetical protein [Patescibacteria group bacterium]MBU4511997.1 hypothetical protein [Patescibacteria group bacterium]MCG2693348.1 hypothetical protein [Candidatus Parcubacteria bacterium]